MNIEPTSQASLSHTPFWPYLSAAAVLTDFEAYKLAPFGDAVADESLIGRMLMDHGEPIRIGPARGRWTLADRSRSAALAELNRQGRLKAALQSSRRGERPDNPTQRALDQLIEQGVPNALGTQTLAELLGLLRAMELLRSGPWNSCGRLSRRRPRSRPD